MSTDSSQVAASTGGPTPEALADWLYPLLDQPAAVQEILERAPGLTHEQAYRVQLDIARRRVQGGDTLEGYKAALTSAPMQALSGINEPLLGTLLRSKIYAPERAISLGSFLVSTLEPEIAVRLGRDLPGPGVTTAQARQAVAECMPAVELGDYRTGENARSLAMTLACNTFNGGWVVGPPVPVHDGLDLRLEGMVMSANGSVRASATAVEVLGDPFASVAFMANKLAELGGTLRAGMVLLTGSIVKSIPIAAGDTVTVEFTRLGRLELVFAK